MRLVQGRRKWVAALGIAEIIPPPAFDICCQLLLHGVVVEISDGGAAFLVIDFEGAAKGMTEKLPRPEYGSIV